MHPLILHAKDTIASWASDKPRDLALAVAALCRETLDVGGLRRDNPDWRKLREAFDIVQGRSIAESIIKWDDCCRYADVDVQTDKDGVVKLGIVTWTVKFIAGRFGMLAGSDPIPDFEEWKQRLCQCLDKYIPTPGF